MRIVHQTVTLVAMDVSTTVSTQIAMTLTATTARQSPASTTPVSLRLPSQYLTSILHIILHVDPISLTTTKTSEFSHKRGRMDLRGARKHSMLVSCKTLP